MCMMHSRKARCYFNSQPHKEADALEIMDAIIFIHFNSQPHKEADWLRLWNGIY